MRQYSAAKQQHPDALLFFRLGDFYELFFDDAKVAAAELQITLTARDRERSVPMCGVPYHAAESYIAKLLRKGFRVALCEQMEDPKLAKKLVRREVTRVLTPGTSIDPSLGQERNNFLAAVHTTRYAVGLAVLDVSTGEFRTTEFHGNSAHDECREELARLAPSEILLPGNDGLFARAEDVSPHPTRAFTALEPWIFTPEYAIPLLERQLRVRSLDGFGLAGHAAAAIAAGATVHYLRGTQSGAAAIDADASQTPTTALEHLQSIRYYERTQNLFLDAVTVRNLELVDPLFSDQSRETTLFHTLDACITPMGKRMLRSAILRPLLDRKQIDLRLDAVAAAHNNLMHREELRRALTGLLDLERLLSRVALDTAGPRDLLALGNSLHRLPEVQAALRTIDSPQWHTLAESCDTLAEVSRSITTTLAPDAPLTLSDGGVIAHGVDAELDELRSLGNSSRQSIAAIEERERTRTGISSLKVRFNSVFGYYLEITKANLKNVPADYERKQTLVNAERFTTPELKDYERRILTAQDRAIEIERRLFADLRKLILDASSRIRSTAQIVAEADMLADFAHLAALRNYTRPTIEDNNALEAIAARHPVVECKMDDAGGGRFVPNDLSLDGERGAIALLTGPNMGGKSTYLRQAALLVIMAQIGCFVPARRLRLGLVDRIYTRIGASDNVARGRSTFMVEMTETATILNTATPRSLILLDEMGRGTSTFDGLALAWATLEFLHENIHARTLFATHYHELTLLAEQLDHLRNLRVTVSERKEGITFLHRIEDGAASKSYGIEVAQLAGLPASVIARARQVLAQHERSERRNAQQELAQTPAPMQMTMFTPLSQRVVDRLRQTDLNALTPLQAMNLLQELQAEIAEGTA
jgi:DNA mismatch repair protein MutS